MAVDDLPRPANPTVDLSGIPASQDTFRSTRQFSVIDKVERQEGHISMALNLGIDHLAPWIRERGFIFFIGASRTCIASSPSTRLSVNGPKYVTSGAWRSR